MSEHVVERDAICAVCMFRPRGHEVVVRLGIFQSHDFAETEDV